MQQATAPKPKAPFLEPEMKKRRIADSDAVLKNMEESPPRGALQERYIDALTITVSDDAVCGSEEEARAYSLIPGVYWKICRHLRKPENDIEVPMFRQEKPEDPGAPNNQELFLICVNSGWHIRTTGEAYFQDMEKNGKTLAWLGNVTGMSLPRAVHVPFWRKKANPAVTVEPSHFYSKKQAARDRHDNEVLFAEVEVLKQRLEVESDAGVVAEPSEHDDSKGSGGHAEGKGSKGKGKGKGKGKSKGGGWYNNAKHLLSLILEQGIDDPEVMKVVVILASKDNMWPNLGDSAKNALAEKTEEIFPDGLPSSL